MIDGGLATQLEARGYDLTGTLWSARVLRDDPDAVRCSHRRTPGPARGRDPRVDRPRDAFDANGLHDADRRALARPRWCARADQVRPPGAGHRRAVAVIRRPVAAIALLDGHSAHRGRLRDGAVYACSRRDLAPRATATLAASRGMDLRAIEDRRPDLGAAAALVGLRAS